MGQSSRKRFKEYRASPDTGGHAEESGSDAIERPTGAAKWAPLREYLRWVLPYRFAVALVFVLATVSALLGLVPPYATKLIIDRLMTGESTAMADRLAWLHLVGGGVFLVLLVQQGIEALRNFRMTVLNARFVQWLRQNLFDHMLRLPLNKLYHMRSGGAVTHLSNDVDEVSGLMQMGLITPGVASLRILLTVSVLFWLQWKMALVACCLIPPIVVLNLFWVRKLRPVYRSIRKDRATANARVVETFGGIRVVRAFLREKSEALDYALSQHLIIRKRVLAQLLQLVMTTGWGLLIPACSMVIVWYGGTRYLAGECTIGGIMAFQMYVFMLLYPVSQIVNSYGDLQRSLASMDRVYDLLNEPEDKPDRPGAVEAPQPLETIEFAGVSFGYQPDRPVVRELNFTVEAGMTVALVGPSGAGKTTVTNLVARFYDPTEGIIRINRTDLRDLRVRSYRSLLGVVEQEVFLFDGTIRENIAYGRRGSSLEEIAVAARRANADSFIRDFPDQYETVIGERGVKLSGGQRQRLSIARALLADPQILILDEATSNLDTESEQLIQAALVDLLSGRTTFVIAHRLSTILHADLILVMRDGRIVESGTHAELMGQDRFYRSMIVRQMARDARTAEALEL